MEWNYSLNKMVSQGPETATKFPSVMCKQAKTRSKLLENMTISVSIVSRAESYASTGRDLYKIYYCWINLMNLQQ